MAIPLELPFCAVVLLATLWALISMVALWQRPAYTFADWQSASDRICREISQISSEACPSCGRSFHRRTYNALLRDLLANTAFILNLVDNACRHLPRPECLGCARDVLNRAISLRLRLYWTRLELCFWPTGAHVLRHRALAAANSYISLCLSCATFLEHYTC